MTSFSGENIWASPEQRSLQELESLVNNPGMTELADLYGKTLSNDPEERLPALQELAADHWDFRKGAERQAINWDDATLGEEGSKTWKVIFNAAEKLGMTESGELQNKTPKYLAILGGANRAPLDRLRFGLEVTDDFEHVVYLGSSRPVLDAEREKAKDYAPNAKTEFDLGSGAFENMLGAKLVDNYTEERDGDMWGTRVYTFEHNGQTKTGFVLSTPATIRGTRATSQDNFKFFADRAELSDDPTATVAAITTGFYTPAQHLAAVQELTLPYGISVETVGHSAEFSGVKRMPKQLLQEAKAGIDAAVMLDTAIRDRYQDMTNFQF